MKYKFEELETRIDDLQDYLGPKVNYTSDKWPSKQPERWLMEFLDILKRRYYTQKSKKKPK